MHPLISLLTTADDVARPGVIDFRPLSSFQKRHIRTSLHIEGPNGLRHRFSWLPPPNNGDTKGKPLIVICKADDKAELTLLLARWNIIDVIAEIDEEAFWSSAGEVGGAEGASLLVDNTQDKDTPALLFQPSPLIEAAMQAVEGEREQQQEKRLMSSVATVLDLGCGAGRDLAWIVRREGNSDIRWLATGIDNLLPAVERARLLRNDYKLNRTDRSSGIECLLWAQATIDTGFLQVLHRSPTSKSRGRILDSDGKANDLSLADFARRHLPHATYDLILFIRFLPLTLLQNIPDLTHSKSVIAISHFTTSKDDEEPDYASPDHSKRFEERHVSMLLDHWGPGWHVLHQTMHRSEDGRPLRSVLFQRS